jgi:hypothetical protein
VAQKETIKPARTQDVASIPLAVLIPDGAHAPPLAYHAPAKSHASVGESDAFNAESRGPALPAWPYRDCPIHCYHCAEVCNKRDKPLVAPHRVHVSSPGSHPSNRRCPSEYCRVPVACNLTHELYPSARLPQPVNRIATHVTLQPRNTHNSLLEVLTLSNSLEVRLASANNRTKYC